MTTARLSGRPGRPSSCTPTTSVPSSIQGSTFSADVDGTPLPPPGACGVSVSAAPQWNTVLRRGILGIHQLQGSASGSVASRTRATPSASWPSTRWARTRSWAGAPAPSWWRVTSFFNTNVSTAAVDELVRRSEWDDAIDAKTNSNLYVYGTIDTSPTPPTTASRCGPSTTASGRRARRPGGPGWLPRAQSGDPGAGLPDVQPACNVGSVIVDYNAIDNTFPRSPTRCGARAPPPTPSTHIACPVRARGGRPAAAAWSPGDSALLPASTRTRWSSPDPPTSRTARAMAGEGAYPGVYVSSRGCGSTPSARTR